jgi:predicted nucleic acid-binding protein
LIRVIVDVSAAAKWFLPPEREQYLPQARRLFVQHRDGEIQLVVPELFWPELGNVFWKAVRRNRWPLAAAKAELDRALRLGIETAGRSRELLDVAFTVATVYDCSVYDATYVALAKRERITLITADEKLVRSLDGHFAVRSLAAF